MLIDALLEWLARGHVGYMNDVKENNNITFKLKFGLIAQPGLMAKNKVLLVAINYSFSLFSFPDNQIQPLLLFTPFRQSCDFIKRSRK